MSQCSSAGSREDCPHGIDSKLDLVMGSSLKTEVASDSNSRMDVLAGSGSVVGGVLCMWSVAALAQAIYPWRTLASNSGLRPKDCHAVWGSLG